MSGLHIYHLWFTLAAQNRIEFGPQVGGQIRGALYDALRRQTCSAPAGHHDPAQAEHCPVCWLMAREDWAAQRGKDIPRAFTVRPPTALAYAAGEQVSFGLTLFGDAVELFPYIVLALPLMGQMGVGYGRGRFHLHTIEARNPLSQQRELLMSPGSTQVKRPTLAVTPERIQARAASLGGDYLTLRFLTPTRLTENGRLVKSPHFRTVMARLLERFDIMNREYGMGDPAPSPYETLVPLAENIQFVRDDTHWVEVYSGSRRAGTMTPISGFVGTASYHGDLAPFREWLLWGQSLQIGKDTVKGNGIYEVI
jgi:hypothetical protein